MTTHDDSAGDHDDLEPARREWTEKDTKRFLEKTPSGDPDCPNCGGVGWVFDYYSDDPDDYQVGRCALCMPPSLSLTPEGWRPGDPEIDCKDIGGRRVRKTLDDVPPESEG